MASVGTDGVDGPTDAAGAIVDNTTERARAAGLEDPGAFLRDNNAYPFFQALGDLVRTGPTGTNVGDIRGGGDPREGAAMTITWEAVPVTLSGALPLLPTMP